MPDHIVQRGECLSSIAAKAGLLWTTIWNHSQNASLKAKRKDPNVLLEGDVLFVPEKEEKHEGAATEKINTFQVKNTPAKFKLRLLKNGKPRANIDYLLRVDSGEKSGKTDGDGRLEMDIKPEDKTGELILKKTNETVVLELGALDPLDETSGLQGRLQNLGYYFGPIDGKLTASTKSAMNGFQRDHNLAPTAAPDDSFKNQLKKAYGC